MIELVANQLKQVIQAFFGLNNTRVYLDNINIAANAATVSVNYTVELYTPNNQLIKSLKGYYAFGNDQSKSVHTIDDIDISLYNAFVQGNNKWDDWRAVMEPIMIPPIESQLTELFTVSLNN